MKGLLIHVCLLAMAIIAPPLSAAGIVLPDSMVTEDKEGVSKRQDRKT